MRRLVVRILAIVAMAAGIGIVATSPVPSATNPPLHQQTTPVHTSVLADWWW